MLWQWDYDFPTASSHVDMDETETDEDITNPRDGFVSRDDVELLSLTHPRRARQLSRWHAGISIYLKITLVLTRRRLSIETNQLI